MQTVKFKYKIGDSVFLKSIEMTGRIDALMLDCDVQQFRVVYWINGERKNTWVYDWEIAAK